MDKEDKRAVSGYGSRLERHVSAAVGRLGTLTTGEADRELLQYLIESLSLGLSPQHLMEALKPTLLNADYGAGRVESILKRIQELLEEGRYDVCIKWAAVKATKHEVLMARKLCPELREMTISECVEVLDRSPYYHFRRCESKLLAMKACQDIESAGLLALTRRNRS